MIFLLIVALASLSHCKTCFLVAARKGLWHVYGAICYT